jgi:hypothetical protein
MAVTVKKFHKLSESILSLSFQLSVKSMMPAEQMEVLNIITCFKMQMVTGELARSGKSEAQSLKRKAAGPLIVPTGHA